MLTPEQIEKEEEHLNQLPTIRNLKEADESLFHELKVLEGGQDDINSRLDKGSERMDGIEDELKNLSDTLRQGLNDVITEIRDHKITELTTELKVRQAEGSTLKTGLILIAATSIVSVIGYLIVKAYG